jgi:hypothetical protein
MNNLEYLFQQLKLLEMKFEKLNETSIDKFNIFSILRKDSDEVNLHSKFIFELLNPNGSHQQGDIFLKLFIKEIDGINFINENPDIFREKYNIDILIQSPNQSIIIENKIYTEDHSRQLSKYLNIVQKKGYIKENIFLIYLTLFGEEPNEEKVRKKVINISYEMHILKWLENCLKEIALIPTIRETINQYIKLVKQLTNQSQYKGFIMEVKDFLLSDINNLKTALDIQKSITEAKIDIQLAFWETLDKSLINQNYKFNFYSANGNKNFKSSVSKFYNQQKNKRYFGLSYQLKENLYFFIEINWNIYYGFSVFQEGKISNQQMEIIKQIDTNWEEENNNLYWKYPKKKLDFERFNNQNVLDLVNEELRIEDVKTIVDDIIYLLTSYNKLSNKT